MISFGVICYYIFREPLTLDNREAVGELQNFPLYFGTVLFALEAIGVVSFFLFENFYILNYFFVLQMLPLENEMKTPKAFVGTCGVLNQAMSVIVFLYVGMGFFGYLKYGDSIQGSITLNLPQDDM